MIICFYSIVLLSVFGLSTSDLMKEEVRTELKNLFLNPLTPQLERCETSLGEHGRCVPLNDCPHLRAYAEGKHKDRLLSVIEDFGCGFRKVVFVCCTDHHILKPFEGLDELKPEGTHHHGEYHHHHHHHPPGLSKPHNVHGNGMQGGLPEGGVQSERPFRKESSSQNFEPSIDEMNKKPVYEEVDEGDDVDEGSQQKESEESKKDKATTPPWESPDYIVSQEDSWVWPNARKSFDKHPGPTTTPDWLVVHQTNTPSGGFGSFGEGTQYNAKPSQVGSSGLVGSSGFGSNSQPIGGTGSFSSGGLLGGQGTTFGGSSQGLGINSQSSSGNYDNQGFSSGSSSFGSGLSNLDNQGFGSSRPGSSLSSSQGFNSGRPSQSGLNSQGPQVFGNQRPNQEFGSIDRPLSQGFGNERPLTQGLGSIDRPLSQGFGNERPSGSGFSSGGLNRPSNYDTENSRPSSGRPSSSGLSSGGLNRPSEYDTENSRPNSGRPSSSGLSSGGLNRPSEYDTENSRPSSGRPGSNRPSSNQGGLFGLGGLLGGGSNSQRPSNQRPSNQGSNKKPSRGGSNKRRLLPDGKCGAEISDKIIGGEDTKLDEFPWMALLHFTTNSGQDRGYGCGGSLINERYVLTAAHCIKGPSLPDNVVVKNVRLGEYDLTKDRDCVNDVCSPKPLDVAVEEIIAHPDYKPNDKAQHHDIALIRLRKKVPFTTYVSPICLPDDELRRKDYTGKQMVVAGWGKTSNGVNAKSSAIKQKVSLPFVTLEECKPFYDGINIRLRNTQLCAGGQRAKDSCQGDSGGPLMTNEIVNGQPSWFATGIVSFGPEDCGIQNIAGVYTKVAEYVDWILDNMKE